MYLKDVLEVLHGYTQIKIFNDMNGFSINGRVEDILKNAYFIMHRHIALIEVCESMESSSFLTITLVPEEGYDE